MKKITLLSLLLALTISCTSQKLSSTDVEPTKYMNTITAEDLKTHLYIVAADSMQGRE
ncbi:MAG: peptidase M28, partial [bacterium]|nr:peptidase M28 [bacterium]